MNYEPTPNVAEIFHNSLVNGTYLRRPTPSPDNLTLGDMIDGTADYTISEFVDNLMDNMDFKLDMTEDGYERYANDQEIDMSDFMTFKIDLSGDCKIDGEPTAWFDALNFTVGGFDFETRDVSIYLVDASDEIAERLANFISRMWDNY